MTFVILSSLLGSLNKHDVDDSENVICNFVCAIISQIFKVITHAKCALTVLELYWKQRFGDKKTKLNICQHMLTSPTQRQNRSFLIPEGTRASAKCPKMKTARAKRAKLFFFSLSNMQICDVLVAVVVVVALAP